VDVPRNVYYNDAAGRCIPCRRLTRVSDATNVWEDVPDWGGVGARRLTRAPGMSLGASVWELQPGSSQFVYHFHHGSEELLVVLRGQPTVRLHDGDRQLEEGDVVSCPRGPEGGHQLRNDGETIARVLIVSTNADPDVAEYPDTGKLAAIVGGQHRYHRTDDAVEHAGPD
jgi:uncharacterized cupin superfamily protein